MNSFRSWPLAVLSGVSLIILSACSPASRPYEPAEPQSEIEEDVPASAFMDDAEVFNGAEIPAAGEVPGADPLLDIEQGHSGETHVHGGGDLSVTREDDFLTVTLDAPLANFGLSESSAPTGTKAEKYADGIAVPLGPTECEETERSVTARSDGAHGALTISVVWRCKKINRVEGLRVDVFKTYPAFEHLDAIYLGPEGEQVARELTAAEPELDFD